MKRPERKKKPWPTVENIHEETEHGKREKSVRRMQNIVVPVCILAGVLIAGVIRKAAGDSIPYIAGSGRRGWPGTVYDPLVLAGLLAGAAAAAIIEWALRRRIMKRQDTDGRNRKKAD